MALLLRNARPYLLPLLRGSRPTSVFAGRAFSSGSNVNRLSFRSHASLGPRDGDASAEERYEEITTLCTGASPTTAPYGDIHGAGSAFHEEPEEGEDGFDYENVDYGFIGRDSRMAQDIRVTFLGTSSGGGPTKTRNCSSLIVDMLGDGTLWSAWLSFLAHFPYRSHPGLFVHEI